MLKDLESVDKRLVKLAHELKGAKNKPAERVELETEQTLLEKIKIALDAGNADEVKKKVASSPSATVPLITSKNYLVIANIAEHELENDAYKNNKHFQAVIKKFGTERVIPVSVKVEYELSQLADSDAQEMMGLIGLKERSLDLIIRKSYENLGLITFFTCGPKEIHAWPINKGISVRKASGEIHSDLERGFICADVFNCADLFAAGTEAKVKVAGKFRTEGQDYVVTDGDILNIKFNV
jgi:ribosome-binding ATPase YchF (GTP1/OBG family)